MRPRASTPARRARLVRALVHVLASAALVVAVMVSLSPAASTTGGVTWGVDVVNSSLLDTSGCRPGVGDVTDFGTVQPGTSAVTNGNCRVVFGSTNASSMLKLYQADGTGTAMARVATAFSSQVGSADGFEDVDLVTTLDAYAVGDSGVIRRTVDGGANWTTEPTSNATTQTLNGVDMVDATNGYAVGNAGVIYTRTTAGGSTWAARTSGVPENLYSVAVSPANPLVAWAVGASGRILKTIDGGATWTAQAVGLTTSGLLDVVAVSSNLVYAAGDQGTIVKTIDGGANWAVQTGVPSGNWLIGIAASSGSSRVYAVGEGSLWSTALNAATTQDTWTATGSTGPSTHGMNRQMVFFTVTADPGNSQTAWAFGQFGEAYRTTNNGASWTEQDLPTWNPIYGASALNANDVWIVGAGKTAYATNGGGGSWTSVHNRTESLLGVSAPAPDTVVAVGSGGAVRYSTTGGTSWSNGSSGTTSALLSVSMATTRIGWAVGDDGVLLRTDDGGATWVAQSISPSTTAQLFGVSAADATHAWAVGAGGVIATTTDGVTWTRQVVGTDDLYAVAAADATNAWAVGNNGKVLRTTNGTTWNAPATAIPTTNPLTGVTAPNAQTAYISRSVSRVYNTQDGGATWGSSTATSGNSLFGIAAPRSAGPTVVRVVGRFGYGFTSVDAGATWSGASNTNRFFYAVASSDAHYSWAVGEAGTIRRTSAGTSFADYDGITNNWASASNLFGACLYAYGGGAVVNGTTWSSTGSCTASDSDPWKPIVPTGATSGAKVAGATVAGTTGATVDLRFGMKVATGLAPTKVYAPLVVETVAPYS